MVTHDLDGPPGDGAPTDLRCSVLLFRAASVLLCQRTDLEDTWVLPGGTPRRDESTANAARREVREETGLNVDVERVAFVMETAGWEEPGRRVEIVFLGSERDRSLQPEQVEDHLRPVFVELADLDKVGLRPPVAGYIRGLGRPDRATAAYLGNLWRPDPDPAPPVR